MSRDKKTTTGNSILDQAATPAACAQDRAAATGDEPGHTAKAINSQTHTGRNLPDHYDNDR